MFFVKDGFLKVSALTPTIRTADCGYNIKQILNKIAELPNDTALAVFPELCITGSTCGDLFLQSALLSGAEKAVAQLLRATADKDMVIVVGVPVSHEGSVYNCAAVCCHGNLLGLVPKITLSQKMGHRIFNSGKDVYAVLRYADQDVYLCSTALFGCSTVSEFKVGIEFADDLFSKTPTSDLLADNGATIIACLSADCQVIGKDALTRQFIEVESKRLDVTYVYANAGFGESVSDFVFAGGNMIAECGTILDCSQPFTDTALVAVTDLQRISHNRYLQNTVSSTAVVEFSLPIRETTFVRPVRANPFIPATPEEQQKRFEEVLTIQSTALAQRLAHTGCDAVLGLSGGLDSALALLVTVRAYSLLKRDNKGICAITMPCFGTTDRTYQNACKLANELGASLREIPIAAAVKQHLSDISHNGSTDVTYENAQARERTQVLMDVSNQMRGLVIGTGDMSELALGWATYNGDHMSMYGVNAGVPKTLVRYLVQYEANRLTGAAQAVLNDILDTPVSPELLPPENGVIAQKTESLVGDYRLHDFFLYYVVRYGFSPAKIYRLACSAFENVFEPNEIKKWMVTFYKRFFAQQFKRNCLPDGPKIGSVCLSPRGDFHMPSDACGDLWIREAESL